MSEIRKRDIVLQVTVRVPATTGENEVETALNAALDETPQTGLDWGDWEVGALSVTDARNVTVTVDEDPDEV